MLKESFGLNIALKHKRINFPNVSTSTHYYCDSARFFLKIKDVACYEVCAKSNTIFIDMDPALREPKLVLTWLNGTVLAYLLQYHGFLVLHASAIVVHGQAVLFCGSSGQGKSTLAATMDQKGYPFLTDDLAVVRFHEQHMELMPMSTGAKLWTDTIAHLGKLSEALQPIGHRPGKFELPIEHAWKHPIQISRVYELHVDKGQGVIQQTPVFYVDKIKLLIRNTYRYSMLKALGKLHLHLQHVTHMASSIPCYQLTRPDRFDCFDEFGTWLDAQLKEDKKTAK
jgi:hypothetical protein